MLSPLFLMEGPEGPGRGACLVCIMHSWTRAAPWPACHARLSWAAPFLARGPSAAAPDAES